MIPKEVDLWLGDYIVPTGDMLHCTCNSCADYLDWKHTIDENLAAACCGVAWNARSHNKKGTMYYIHGGKVDLTNVKFFVR